MLKANTAAEQSIKSKSATLMTSRCSSTAGCRKYAGRSAVAQVAHERTKKPSTLKKVKGWSCTVATGWASAGIATGAGACRAV